MIIRTIAAGTIVAAFALCGCATTRDSAATPVAAARPSTCLTATGSRIPPSGADCAGYGNSYSQDDLNRTGKTNVNQALGMLDPSITVNH